jgi:GDP-mannose 6-dehydrogenase
LKISIFGLGYVGSVLTACFAKDGHEVIGVDSEPTKVDLINGGQSPIIEPGLQPLIEAGVRSGRIRATADVTNSVANTEISMICVGTPCRSSGEQDLSFVTRVCESIGTALRDKTGYHLVVVRSTVLPGTVEAKVIPALEQASGRKFGIDFGVAMNPEFLRESTAIADFYVPPKTVIGASSDRDLDLVASLYSALPGPLIRTRIKVAEMVKYTDNIFHALKITFGNEIGTICKQLGIDGHEVMNIMCQDRKLNISPAYLKPGFAYGGSCLPKDLRAMTWLARNSDLEVPLLNAISPGNEQQIKNAVRRVIEIGRRKIGVLGFAFKGGTDDLRESPVVTLIETLLGKGYDLRLYDSHVSLAKLIGANKRFIEEHIPHISRLMVNSMPELFAHAELIIIGNDSPEFFEGLRALRADQRVIDLTPSGRPLETAAATERLSA